MWYYGSGRLLVLSVVFFMLNLLGIGIQTEEYCLLLMLYHWERMKVCQYIYREAIS